MIALSQDFIENAVRILVTRFIPLHPSDLERWIEDPEEWVSEESKDNDQWEYEIRVSVVYYSRYFSVEHPATGMQRAALDDVVFPIPGNRYTPSKDHI